MGRWTHEGVDLCCAERLTSGEWSYALVHRDPYWDLVGALPHLDEGLDPDMWGVPVFEATRYIELLWWASDGIRAGHGVVFLPHDVMMVAERLRAVGYGVVQSLGEALVPDASYLSEVEYEALTRYFEISAEYGYAISGWVGRAATGKDVS